MLEDYLARVARDSRALDCCRLMADWLVIQGCSDPMADRRGTYSTRGEYRKMLRGEGGLVKSCTARFARIGLVSSEPRRGAIAVVMAPFALRNGRVFWRPTGAICLSEKLHAVVSSDGLSIAPLPVMTAWAHA
jgi:hypothetical protein